MDLPKVSIIIPAYNCEQTIAAAVNDCLSQRYPSVEVIVVDDGSTDATAAILGNFSRLRWIKQENKGPASARNAGAKAATGEFLAFTDSDCAAHEDWIEKLMAHFSDKTVGAVAGSYWIANDDNMLARCIQMEIAFRHRQFKGENIKALGSYNFAIRKALFDHLGGFDESYRRASGEDNDLSYRILASGHRIVFAKDALVDHTHTESVGRYLREQFRHGFWRAKLYLDHPAMAQGDDYTFWKDGVETLACMAIAVLAALAPAAFAAAQSAALALVAFYIFEFIFLTFLHWPLKESLFYAWVMLWRSFARTFGLATGIMRFIFISRRKKVK